jgi:SAM-dependent methyltransferase
MTREVHEGTKAAYKDPLVVRKYHEAYGMNLHDRLAEDFANSLSGKRVLDFGCGPGHYAQWFSHRGFDSFGLDYSEEMIEVARRLSSQGTPPQFTVGDMRDVGIIYPEKFFDGIWANASLLHIRPDETGALLDGMYKVLSDKGKVCIRIKKGKNGVKVKRENLYGRDISREYTYWDKETFTKLLEEHGFKVTLAIDEHEDIRVERSQRSIDWLQFHAEVSK